MAGFPAQVCQQLAAIGRLPCVPRHMGPDFPLFRQPAVWVGVALNLVVEVQHKLLQTAVIPAKAEGIRQLQRARRQIAVKFLQHPRQYPAAQQRGLVFIQYPEIRRQPPFPAEFQQVDVLSCQGCAEGVNGLDIRLIYQQQLPLQMTVAGTRLHPLAQFPGNPLPQLRRRGAGIGDNEEVVHIGLLLP